jgi:hypothetical protein
VVKAEDTGKSSFQITSRTFFIVLRLRHDTFNQLGGLKSNLVPQAFRSILSSNTVGNIFHHLILILSV